MVRSRSEAFSDWLEVISQEPELGFDPALLSQGARAWYEEIFDEHGEVPPAYLLRLLFERRLSLARFSLDLLRTVAERDLGKKLQLEVQASEDSDIEPSGEVEVYGEQIRALDLQEALTATASGIQAFAADTQWVVWPTCTEHRCGLHPTLVVGRAVWHCTVGSHDQPMHDS